MLGDKKLINMIGIYRITSPSGKIYIGQSTNIFKRLSVYKRMPKQCKQSRLMNSFKKYGVDKHIFEIVEQCEIHQLNDRERYWQDYYDCIGKNGLNCVLTKSSDKSGLASNELKKRFSDMRKGKPNGQKGKKYPQRSGENHHRYGKEMSVEQRYKLSKALKGRIPHNKGKNISNEQKEKLRIAHLGKGCGEAHPFAHIILNTETGIYYFGTPEASSSFSCMKSETLRGQLKGYRKNKTSMIIV